MKRLIKDPLLHFLLLGGVIFAAYSLLSRPDVSAEPGKIVVSVGQIEHLAASFAQAWLRPPSNAELKGLVDDWVREEIAVRESIAIGLEKDDAVIRRRLRQKIEFISDDTSARAEPTDADLNAYLQAHPDAFRVEPLLTFRQVYLNPERHGDQIAHNAAQLLAQLNQAGGRTEVSALGDPILLPQRFAAAPASDVAKQFGGKFAAQLAGLKSGQWQGPIESAYGLHLVYISEQSERGLPPLVEVRDAVHREWSNTRRLESTEKFYNELLSRYVVIIERPESVDTTKISASGVRGK
jgi:hypothetical protein